MISNVAMVFAPLIFALTFALIFIHAYGFLQQNQQNQKKSSLLKAKQVLDLYERECHNFPWEKLKLLNQNENNTEPDYIPDETSRLLADFFDSGFRFSIFCNEVSIFKNIEDENFIFQNKNDSAWNAVFYSGEKIIIKDSFFHNDDFYQILALYDENVSNFDAEKTLFSFRKNQIFFMLVFIFFVFIFVVLLNFFLTNYLSKEANFERQMKNLSEMAKIENTEIIAKVAGENLVPDFLAAVPLKKAKENVISLKDLKIFPASRRVTVRESEVNLKNKEFELLLFLAENPDIVFSKNVLFDRVWGQDACAESATVTVHINRLREKIEKNPSSPDYIKTVWGAGYKFAID